MLKLLVLSIYFKFINLNPLYITIAIFSLLFFALALPEESDRGIKARSICIRCFIFFTILSVVTYYLPSEKDMARTLDRVKEYNKVEQEVAK